LCLGAFKSAVDRHDRSLRLVPAEQQSFWHITRQPDGSITTQIACRFNVHNLTTQAIQLADFQLVRPKFRGTYLAKSVSVQQTGGRLAGRYDIPPLAATEGDLHLILLADLTPRWGGKFVFVATVLDQFGRRHVIKIRNLRKS